MRKKTKFKIKLFIVSVFGIIWLIQLVSFHFFAWVLAALLILSISYVLFKLFFKPEKYIDSRGYVVLTKWNELEHRYIAKQIFNRELNRNEVVHHINGKKTDNNINNLCLMISEKHEFFHSWLSWKKNKSGKYPSIQEQKRVLESEYSGKLLEKYQNTIVKSNIDNNYELKKVVQNNLESDESKLASVENHFDIEMQRKLLIELKKLRKELAFERNIPVYMIFDNKTLIEMSEKMPETDSEFLQIRGVGDVKLKMWGPYFLDVIIKFKFEDKPNKRTKSDSA